LERAIGVIYRPETELESHYFNARLPEQFNEYIWFDEARAVTPCAPGNWRAFPTPIRLGFSGGQSYVMENDHLSVDAVSGIEP
jgi:protein-L-isoaspartate(D-aspartate) O-methyltransferase